MKITKKEILKAIEKEPLNSGSFIQKKNNYLSLDELKAKSTKDKDCVVCAVGAVLRNKFKDIDLKTFIDKCEIATNGNFVPGFYAESEAQEEINKKNYLGALSIQFEAMCDTYKTMRSVRNNLSEYVKENFPESFTVKGI